MCRICSNKLFNASDYSTGLSGLGGAPSYARLQAHLQAAADSVFGYNLTTAFVRDGIGDDPPPNQALAPLATTTDNVPDGITGSNPVITVGGPHIISTTDTPGDQDFYKVELQAGVKYNIGMYGAVGGPSGVPQPDAFIELYDAAGNLIAYEDGNGRTPSGELYGLDAMLTITVATTGTYYINARAFDQEMDDDTTTGDTIGDYDLFVEINTDPPAPVDAQYYPITSPLRSIDWGTQVDGTVRNPDGNEGTRVTGNAQGTPDSKGATVGYWGQSTEGKNVIKIYFAKPGDVYVSSDPTDPGLPPAIVAVGAKDFEITAIWIALREFEKVADIVYVETQNREEADFHYVTYSGTPGPGISLLGSMNPPQENDEGLAQFNSGDYRWSATNLQQGGFSFVTLIHEFGHGHGLAHPHDTGGESTRMPGVKAIINTPAGPVPEPTNTYPNYTRGEFDLNQGVFTMMSYQDGWETSPYGNAKTDVGYGYLGGLMAFDIAAIQDKYGVNEEWATGDDVYTLKDVNAAGTFYSSIWDAGGNDTIVYDGARDANIDLRQATLKYEFGGGGFVSYAYGIYGGFTIANGVTIENAIGGSGNDRLTGNAANNRLEGNAGNDTFYLWFGGGDDTALGGSGNDVFFFGGTFTSADVVRGGADSDILVLQGAYGALALTGNVTEIEGISLLGGNNMNFGEPGTNRYDYSITTHDSNFAAGLQVKINGAALLEGEDFTFDGSAETDAKFVVYGGRGKDTLTGGLGNDIFFFDAGRFASGDTVNGGSGYDGMFLRGNYTIDFNAPGYTGLFTSIENLTLTSATDERYARGGGS
ncbi:MAG TPA: M10 family metallopeptidase C-terminal domain-containing protein, partial [Allosphingosinicella sp.]|nr:M10 family metallopeptidase C-terminal domain-containing protein [Allosphingosinicella sp.]